MLEQVVVAQNILQGLVRLALQLVEVIIAVTQRAHLVDQPARLAGFGASRFEGLRAQSLLLERLNLLFERPGHLGHGSFELVFHALQNRALAVFED